MELQGQQAKKGIPEIFPHQQLLLGDPNTFPWWDGDVQRASRPEAQTTSAGPDSLLRELFDCFYPQSHSATSQSSTVGSLGRRSIGDSRAIWVRHNGHVTVGAATNHRSIPQSIIPSLVTGPWSSSSPHPGESSPRSNKTPSAADLQPSRYFLFVLFYNFTLIEKILSSTAHLFHGHRGLIVCAPSTLPLKPTRANLNCDPQSDKSKELVQEKVPASKKSSVVVFSKMKAHTRYLWQTSVGQAGKAIHRGQEKESSVRGSGWRSDMGSRVQGPASVERVWLHMTWDKWNVRSGRWAQVTGTGLKLLNEVRRKWPNGCLYSRKKHVGHWRWTHYQKLPLFQGLFDCGPDADALVCFLVEFYQSLWFLTWRRYFCLVLLNLSVWLCSSSLPLKLIIHQHWRDVFQMLRISDWLFPFCF